MNDGGAAAKAATAWRDRLTAVDDNAHWATWQEVGSLRSLLYALHDALLDTPPDLLQEFDQFEEKALIERANRLTSHPDARVKFAAAESHGDALFQAAALLRALDMLLEEGAEAIHDEAPDCWLDAEAKVYLVPIAHRAPGEEPRTGQIFTRRGLLRHRVIPRSVGGTDIRLTAHPDVTPAGAPAERTMGAAIFTGFSLQYERTRGKRFIVTAVDCHGGIGNAVARQCAAARTGGCDTIVWPELTIDPARVDLISNDLAAEPLATGPPPVVVAGSWHVAGTDGTHNLASVFDGRGDRLLEFGKSRRFTIGGLTEDIVVDGTVHLLVTDRDIIAFAICKDFCDKAMAVPVKQLDVDVVVVPSMGAANTMTAHRDAADDMKVRYGTRTMVVQQTYPVATGDPPGFILALPRKPREAELAGLAARLEFTTFQREAEEIRSS